MKFSLNSSMLPSLLTCTHVLFLCFEGVFTIAAVLKGIILVGNKTVLKLKVGDIE